jgi:hypothetical protein
MKKFFSFIIFSNVKSAKKSALSVVLFCAVFFPAQAATRYVTVSGAGLMNGSSWGNAFPGGTLQAAINSSIAGDQVWVAAGTYFTTAGTNRNIYFSMQNGVAIYGSFNGTETTLSQRNFVCGFSSVLSAEIGLPGNSDNSYHVISNSSVNSSAVLDGFTLTGGHANFDLLGNDNRSLGGGMFNNAANGGTCTPTITNCLFTSNTALFGGGIFNHGQNAGNASPLVTNCIFYMNTATGGGGGIDNFGYNGNASPVITNSIFYMNNATDRAGAMYCWGGGNGNASPTILNSVFVNNTSVDGGGIVADRSNFTSGNSGTATPNVRNSIFWGNTASGTGPQFFIIGGAGFDATYSAIDVSNQNAPHAITGPGTGNSNTAPTFLNISSAVGADNCWLTADDGLQLQLISAGIDVGNNTGVPATDIRSFNRIVNGVVDFGPYEFNSTILPVSLIDFSGMTAKDFNVLSWSTATENNLLFFEIEKSTDAIHFEKLVDVDAHGNSSSRRDYKHIDYSLSGQQNYYRIKMVDTDGKYSFSKIIFLTNKNTKEEITVFPNPVVSNASIIFQTQSFLKEEFMLMNSNGQVIDRILITGRMGYINLSGKAAGLYYLVSKKKNLTIRLHKVAE